MGKCTVRVCARVYVSNSLLECVRLMTRESEYECASGTIEELK